MLLADNHRESLMRGRNDSRSSLACERCRMKRKRCDAKKPICGACTQSSAQCTWPQRQKRGRKTGNVDSTLERQVNETDAGPSTSRNALAGSAAPADHGELLARESDHIIELPSAHRVSQMKRLGNDFQRQRTACERLCLQPIPRLMESCIM